MSKKNKAGESLTNSEWVCIQKCRTVNQKHKQEIGL